LQTAESSAVRIKAPVKSIELSEVKKDREDRIDSTGNLLWPSEELLAYVLMKDAGIGLKARAEGR
jgi:hypothetical protein